MSIKVENNSKDKKPVQQIDNNNLLYDLAKVNCKLTFFHKEKDFTFYENFKRLLSTNINTTTTLSPEGKRLYYYVKYYEGNDSEKYSFSEISILKDMNIIFTLFHPIKPPLSIQKNETRQTLTT